MPSAMAYQSVMRSRSVSRTQRGGARRRRGLRPGLSQDGVRAAPGVRGRRTRRRGTVARAAKHLRSYAVHREKQPPPAAVPGTRTLERFHRTTLVTPQRVLPMVSALKCARTRASPAPHPFAEPAIVATDDRGAWRGIARGTSGRFRRRPRPRNPADAVPRRLPHAMASSRSAQAFGAELSRTRRTPCAATVCRS